MIFSCGLTSARAWELYRAKREQWHDFFAIWPRVVAVDEHGKQMCAWMQTIERRSSFQGYGEYGPPWVNEFRVKPSGDGRGTE